MATGATNPVTIALDNNPGGATLSGTTTQNAVAGVATFNDLSLDRMGTGYTFVATSPGLESSTSSTFVITPAGAGQVTFLVQPTNTTAGQAIAPPVQVETRDGFGNLTDTTVTMTIGTNPGMATLRGSVRLNTVNGVATFADLNLDLGGAGYTLVATADTGATATSDAFTITAGVAGQIAFLVQPTNANAGQVLAPPVQVETRDAFGNLTDTTVTLTIGNNPGGATLGGTAQLNTTNGVASFADLTVSAGGTGYTLVATATPGPNTTSNAFDVQGLGNFLVSDSANLRVAQFDDLAGTNWTTLAATGNDNVYGLARDAQGRIYYSEFSAQDRIVRVDDITGANPVTFGSIGGGVNQFNWPLGLDIDSQGRLFIADSFNGRIVRIDDMSGANWTELGGFNRPFGLAFDATGRIYVADLGGQKITRVDDMAGTNLVSLNLGFRPADVAVDATGRIYATAVDQGRLVRVDDIAGANLVSFGTPGSGANQFNNPYAVVVNAAGQIFVCDAVNGRICRFDDMAGTNFTTFGVSGAGVNQFSFPYQLLVP